MITIKTILFVPKHASLFELCIEYRQYNCWCCVTSRKRPPLSAALGSTHSKLYNLLHFYKNLCLHTLQCTSKTVSNYRQIQGWLDAFSYHIQWYDNFAIKKPQRSDVFFLLIYFKTGVRFYKHEYTVTTQLIIRLSE